MDEWETESLNSNWFQEQGLWDDDVMGRLSTSPPRHRMRLSAASARSSAQSRAEQPLPRRMNVSPLSLEDSDSEEKDLIMRSSAAAPQRRSSSSTRLQARWWAMTINNPQVHYPNWKEDMQMDKLKAQGVTALVAVHEVGESGTPHLQCTVGFERMMTMRQVSALFQESHPHLEICKDRKASWEYCLKTAGERVMWDTRHQRHHKQAVQRISEEAYESGLQGNISRLVAEASSEYLFRNAVSISRNLAAAPSLVNMNQRKRVQPLLLWVFGGTGTGKTNFMMALVEKMSILSCYFLPVPESGQRAWFDGLTAAHDMVVMDEFRASTMSLNKLCQVVSSVPTKLECKGASVNFSCSVVVILGPAAPWECYSQSGEDVGQVTRRVDMLLEFLPQRSLPVHLQSSQGVSSSFVMPSQAGAAASASMASASSVPDAVKWARHKEAHSHMFDNGRKGRVKIHWQTDQQRCPEQSEVIVTARALLDELCGEILE